MKPAVLIVDDDPSVVRMLEMGLADEYEIIPVFDPAQAINVFSETAIDIVVSDIKMPGLSGFDILRSVKAANPLVEVILLTGELPDKSRPAVNALQSGAHDYLLKPVGMRVLKAAIQQALAKQRQQLEDKRKLQELLRRANTDFLTGLSNRHHFQTQVKLEFERSDRYERSVSCLLLDVAMPGMSGPELQQELKRLRQEIPIVFITAHSDESVRPEFLARGAAECLFKPFSETALIDALNTALRMR